MVQIIPYRQKTVRHSRGVDSPSKPIEYGVPQGSILGPLLFIIYINDLPEISIIAKFILYADDANIFITGSSIREVYEKLKIVITALLNWVDANGLALNLKKTNYMIFSRTNVKLDHDLIIDNAIIKRKAEARFLGVIIDEKLKWSQHISTVKTKMARYIGIMYKLKQFLPIQARLKIYHSLVQSHLNFCSLVWGFASKSHIESLFAKQKIGMRAVMTGYVNYRYNNDNGELPSHTKQSFKEYNILTIHGIIVKNALLFMHKKSHFPRQLPPSIIETIPNNAPIVGSDHNSCSSWFESYGRMPYCSSIFLQRPTPGYKPRKHQHDNASVIVIP